MEIEKASTRRNEEEEEDVPLPGFRFHPTDEELVGFYLLRKVEKRPISLELIKQIDIYKYDPWDLPKASNGDKEWYFFCKRGRKYRNSIRPNRVTGSGFWKATGIDRPIYSTNGTDCIGLKKSLVYYRGCAGKGTKTDWMMHEFRLPPNSNDQNNNKHSLDDKIIAQEAEVWTLCRILKRNVSHKKCLPDWREMAAKRNTTNTVDVSSKTCSADSDNYNLQSYISFQGPAVNRDIEKKPFAHHHHHHVMNMNMNGTATNSQLLINQLSSMSSQAPSTASNYSSFSNMDMNEFIKNGDWDDLRSVVEFAAADPIFFM